MPSLASEPSYRMFNDADTMTPSDSDGDGITDTSDSYHMQPETVNRFEDTDGCQDVTTVKDSDNDGIPNNEDLCPREAETINNY